MASGIVESSSQDSSQQSPQQQQQGTGRSKLVQRLLGSSGNLPQFLNDLLNTMAVVVAGTEAAGFLVERQNIPAQTVPGAAGNDGVATDDAADPGIEAAQGSDGEDEVAPA